MKYRIAALLDLLIGGTCEKLEHVGACGMSRGQITIPLTRSYYHWFVRGEYLDWDNGKDQWGRPAAREINIPNPLLPRLYWWANDNLRTKCERCGRQGPNKEGFRIRLSDEDLEFDLDGQTLCRSCYEQTEVGQ